MERQRAEPEPQKTLPPVQSQGPISKLKPLANKTICFAFVKQRPYPGSVLSAGLDTFLSFGFWTGPKKIRTAFPCRLLPVFTFSCSQWQTGNALAHLPIIFFSLKATYGVKRLRFLNNKNSNGLERG